MLHKFERFVNEQHFSIWLSENNLSSEIIFDSLSLITKRGIDSKFFGYVPPEEVVVSGNNYREQLKVKGLNSRQRALLEVLVSELSPASFRRTKIYAPEAITDLACVLRGRFPWFIGSEYVDNAQKKKDLFPIACEDLQNLSFDSETFDVVLTCDVLEHVADIRKSLAELARVLREDGLMLSTHPFTWRKNSTVRAVLKDGELIHILKPEYHGNPIDPKNGSLVFTVPGWDILEMCLDVGFKKAEMIMIASSHLGIIGSDNGYVNVLRAQK